MFLNENDIKVDNPVLFDHGIVFYLEEEGMLTLHLSLRCLANRQDDYCDIFRLKILKNEVHPINVLII